MNQPEQQVKLPCKIYINDEPEDDEYGAVVSVPDLCIEVGGANSTEALARAVETVTALYYYYRERNVKLPQHTTWQEIEQECRNTSAFPTYVMVV